jgi:hypothetical protein
MNDMVEVMSNLFPHFHPACWSGVVNLAQLFMKYSVESHEPQFNGRVLWGPRYGHVILRIPQTLKINLRVL